MEIDLKRERAMVDRLILLISVEEISHNRVVSDVMKEMIKEAKKKNSTIRLRFLLWSI